MKHNRCQKLCVARASRAGDDCGILDHLLGQQDVFDLAELNAEASHLDLVIDTAEKLQASIGPIAGQIAGIVQAGIGFIA